MFLWGCDPDCGFCTRRVLRPCDGEPCLADHRSRMPFPAEFLAPEINPAYRPRRPALAPPLFFLLSFTRKKLVKLAFIRVVVEKLV